MSVEALGEALKVNSSVTNITLKGNRSGDEGLKETGFLVPRSSRLKYFGMVLVWKIDEN